MDAITWMEGLADRFLALIQKGSLPVVAFIVLMVLVKTKSLVAVVGAFLICGLALVFVWEPTLARTMVEGLMPG